MIATFSCRQILMQTKTDDNEIVDSFILCLEKFEHLTETETGVDIYYAGREKPVFAKGFTADAIFKQMQKFSNKDTSE